MGNQFNFKIGKIRTHGSNYSSNSPKFDYTGLQNETVNCRGLGRMGHLTFVDGETGYLLVFGGQKAGSEYKSSSSQRILTNDILVYDFYQNKEVDCVQLSEGSLPSRLYCDGFKIDNFIYVIGGMGNQG